MDVAAVTGMVGNFDDDQLEEAMGMSLAGSAAVSAVGSEDEADLRRGPWSLEEDVLLVNYIAKHGEGRWNSLARSAGLKRTGKSCRLRWLNYLRPDVRRGNITPEEQLLILELHSRWGNRWSKIAQHLPGRTDNEIKNYWRTRVQKHAKQLRCEVNSRQFRDVVRFVWMPRLVERIQAEAGAGGAHDAAAMAVGVLAPATTVSAPAACQMSASAYSRQSGAPLNEQAAHQCRNHEHTDYYYNESAGQTAAAMSPDDTSSALRSTITAEASHAQHQQASTTTTPTNEGGGVMQCGGAATDDVVVQEDVFGFGGSWSDLLATTGCGESMISLPDFELGDFEDNVWSQEDLGLHQQHWS